MGGATDSQGPPAGWYPDPMGAHGMERRWDGSAWTEDLRPATIELAPPPDPAQRDDADTGAAAHHGHGVADLYHEHQRGIDTAAGIGLLADGAIGNPLDMIRGDRRKPGRITGSLTTIFAGAIFVAVGIFLGHYTSIPAKMTATASGSIEALNPLTQSVSATRPPAVGGGLPSTSVNGCRPVAEFVVNGHSYTATLAEPISPCPYSDGEHVTVRYDPSSPSDAQIPSGPMVPRIVPSASIGIGVVLAIVGVLGLLEAAALIGGGLWFLSKARRE